ncbi:MFS general substrate transporter [Cryphonectria parasitica EP155]|uniref:MFS general substrate transporter n=1 Tax=Cryphonectria parasitica (strain ATCC 38755 / EP155) TaxID=660469 RepID=A0A9P5CNC1_CRYP1|nr:MFS general substrate transporter [Cryphonectria parasitica EP155]KAF3764162.1 MFS general substrate transporter [Cryphonectria parasitica EP155]
MASQDADLKLEQLPADKKTIADDDVSISRVKSVTAGEIVNLDAGEVFLREHNFHDDYLAELLADASLNKRLVRKIDLVILPLLAGTYVLQYIDKQAMSYAAVFDLLTGTGISLDQYGWFTSIFYFAYLFAEYPWMWLVQKTLMAKIVGCCVMVWGAILMITAACSNFGGLAACRFFLGIFEAPITTCFMLIVAMWYTRQEQPFRAGVFYCCNGVGSMIGGILTYGIGQLSSFPVWKAIFLLCGGITVCWGALLFFFLPDSILSAKRFSLEEKALLIARGRLAHTGILNKTIKWTQVREALTDPQVWLLFLFVLLNEVVNGGYASFGKLIIKGLVNGSLKTTALGIPQGAFQVVWILSGTYVASRFKNARTIVMATYNVPTIIGTSLMGWLARTDYDNKIGVLLGYYICGSYVASLVLALQMPATNLGGYTKRTTGSALVFLAYCAGNIIGPHAFLEQESPTYPTGCKVILACAVAQVCAAMAIRALLSRRNKKRDEAAAAALAAGEVQDPSSYDAADMTDFENPCFRYVL